MANPTTRREHVGAASPALLTTSMSNSDMAFSVSTNTGWPTGGVGTFFVVIEPGTSSEEKVLCITQSSSLVTVAPGGRGADGTTARTHPIGAMTYPIWAAAEADELNLHAASTTAVHGVAGAVIGTTDAQTLTNKTIASSANTINVTGGAIDTVLAAKQPLDASSLTNSVYAAASGALTVTTTLTDITGATVTITTVAANTVVLVHGVFDVTAGSVTGTDICSGTLDVDGAGQAAAALFWGSVGGVTNFRSTVTQMWRVTLATAGSHTLKLRGSKTANTAGSYLINATHTGILVQGRF